MFRGRNTPLRDARWILGASKRILAVAIAALAFLPPAAAQTHVTLDTSLTLFSVLSAVHVAGYTPGAPRQAMPSVRTRLLEELSAVRGPATEELRQFFAQHRRPDPAADLSRYVSFALVVDGPPNFEFKMARIQLPPDVLKLEGLNQLVRDFYAEAQLGRLWRTYQPQYEAAVAELQLNISQALLVTEAYLRLPPPNFPGREYRIYFDLLLDPKLTFARNYTDDYYLVLSPVADAPMEEIRHAYLHFLLDPIAGKYASLIQTKKDLYPIALRAQLLPGDFRSDFTLFTTECLIQAAEIRLNRWPAARATEAMDAAEKQGFVLTRAFYDALEKFEQSEPSIKLYFSELIRGIDVASELHRLERIEFARRLPPAPPAAVSPLEALLRDADNALGAGDAATARRQYQAALDRFGPEQPRALYGLAVVAGLERDWPLAKQYFLRTLEKARDPKLLAWSHVYLGRIYDVEGNRDQALGEYQAALAAGADSPDVQQAAQRGLERPFGPERPPAPAEEKLEKDKK